MNISSAQNNINRVIEALIILFQNEHFDSRFIAVKALKGLGVHAQVAIEPLIALLKDERWYVRASVAEALGQLQAEAAIKPLIALLKDEHWPVRYHAAEAIGELKAKTAIEPLIALLGYEDDSDVRVSARWALKQIRGDAVETAGT